MEVIQFDAFDFAVILPYTYRILGHGQQFDNISHQFNTPFLVSRYEL